MVEVRPLGPDDWQTVRELRLAALLDAPEAFGGTYEQSLERTEEEWRAWPANGQPFAAYLGDKPVGMAAAIAKSPQTTILISMWVSPEARGTGTSRALIDAVTQWARDRGSETVELDVYESNEPAYRSYLKVGFTPVGPCPEHPRAILMTLPLSGGSASL
ncbi:GNAT family N-acetyltransferase [Allorhizocola rhizosphaerae]|uniref:GNAT family N-acetyltransferase n=1 Tax=Allorhizocola rhizosphaerae TaxID=1872709 RepID=UPI000E3C3BCA|nr:GNAT family N-acetyltransferase [Allorhizocola rhizosphaerae]